MEGFEKNPLAGVNMEYLHRLQDAKKEALYSQWNALLSFNGILMAAFSVIGVLGKGNKLVLLILLACSILSSLFLIWNYVIFGNLYGEIIDTYLEQSEFSLDENTRRRQKKESQSQWRKRRTLSSQILIVLEIIILFIFVITIP